MSEERAKNKKPYTIHQTDIVINRDVLSKLIVSRDLDYKELHGLAVEKYGLDISYKGFMSLLKNKSAWKLIYAWAICDILNVEIKYLFRKENINVEKRIQEKEEWKKRYQR